MEVRFEQRTDGQVDAFLGPEHVMLNEALADCISSLPPRGEPGNGPSTYWVDVAERGARQAAQTGDTRPFTSGNATLLRVEGQDVVAALDFDEDVTERIPLADFLGLLSQWRSHIAADSATATEPLPETYRRNPAPT